MAAPTPPVGLSPAQLDAMLSQHSQKSAAPPAPPLPPPQPTSITCTNCGSTNESRLRFCMTCGSRLAAAAPAPTPAPAPVAYVAPQPVHHAPIAPQQPQHPFQPQQHQFAQQPQQPIQPQQHQDLGATPFTGSPVVAPAVCGRCHGSNDPGSTFCRFCGAQLAQQAQPVVPAQAQRPSHTVPVPAVKPATADAAETRETPAAVDPPTPLPSVMIEPSPPAPVAAPAPVAVPAPVTPVAEAPAPVAAPAPIAAPAPAAAPAPPAEPTVAKTAAPPSVRPNADRAAAKSESRGRVVVVAKDGTESASFPLQERVDVGRHEGELRFPEDPYLSARHLRIYERGGTFYVKDLGTLNGTFLRLRDGESVAIEAGALFLVGQQLLRLVAIAAEEEIPAAAREHGVLLFGTPPFPRYARLEQRSVEGTTLDVYHLHKTETVLGRESGDVVFSDDAFLSRRHAAVRFDKATRKFELVDLHSSNGSFARIGNEIELKHRDQVRVGQQLLRIELNEASDKTSAGKSEGGSVPRSRG